MAHARTLSSLVAFTANQYSDNARLLLVQYNIPTQCTCVTHSSALSFNSTRPTSPRGLVNFLGVALLYCIKGFMSGLTS
jgi:hypothetical protein